MTRRQPREQRVAVWQQSEEKLRRVRSIGETLQQFRSNWRGLKTIVVPDGVFRKVWMAAGSAKMSLESLQRSLFSTRGLFGDDFDAPQRSDILRNWWAGLTCQPVKLKV